MYLRKKILREQVANHGDTGYQVICNIKSFNGVLYMAVSFCTHIFLYTITALPWLLCPGLCCIGIAGMALYATNLQVESGYLYTSKNFSWNRRVTI